MFDLSHLSLLASPEALREHLLQKRMFSFGHCPNYLPPSPQFRQIVKLVLGVKNNVLTRITEPSNNDYGNDGSDNCDYNFVTFDDFGVRNDQKVSHNMILMSKYKGQHGGKKGKKFGQGPPPPPFRAMPERKRFYLGRGG